MGYADNMSNQNFLGQWKVEKWVAGSLNTDIGQQDINNIIGSTLIISTQMVTLNANVLDPDDRSCSINANTSGWINTDPVNYFNNNYDWPNVNISTIQALGLEAPFWTIDTDCIPIFTTKKPNQIVFIFGSTFFEAQRVSNS